MEMKSVFEVLNVIFLVSFLISGLLFTRLTIRRLDRKVKEEGSGTPSWDRGGVGLRVGMYAGILVRGKKGKSPLANEDIILRHARPIDRFLAFFMDISLIGMILLGITGLCLGYFD
mgnify:FL=1